jgi:hypothetical protein
VLGLDRKVLSQNAFIEKGGFYGMDTE